MKIKRKLEIQAIRDNKQAALTKTILDMDKPVPRREAMKERSARLRKTLAAVLKLEAKEQAKKARAMDVVKQRLGEEMKRRMKEMR